MTGADEKVTLIEVGPRDGFQNIKTPIPTETKLQIIRALISSGIPEIEITSFVHPKAVPQMADAGEVSRIILPEMEAAGRRAIALVPNLRGAKNAWDCGVRTVSCVISASESHNQANVARSRKESLEDLRGIVRAFPEMIVRLDLATAFGCPYEGPVDEKEVLQMAEMGLEAGVLELVLCDTIGVANPHQVQSIGKKVLELAGEIPVALHLHDTRGLGVANVCAGYQIGIRRFEAAVGGLGGCPFAPGAAGNTAMEDTVHLFESMGIFTGVKLEEYLKAVELVKLLIKPDLTGRMSFACPYPQP